MWSTASESIQNSQFNSDRLSNFFCLAQPGITAVDRLWFRYKDAVLRNRIECINYYNVFFQRYSLKACVQECWRKKTWQPSGQNFLWRVLAKLTCVVRVLARQNINVWNVKFLFATTVRFLRKMKIPQVGRLVEAWGDAKDAMKAGNMHNCKPKEGHM